ncbi:MAG: radical SAM protein [Actinobacteria bacterium]|nr:MAG: radical SAM protein [Actinomycetota bacterium]
MPVKTWIIQPYHPSNVTLRLNVALRKKVYMLPLTVTTLARLVLDLGHEARVIDENVEAIPLEENMPDIALITAMTPTAPRAYKIADELRRRGVTVVLGGIHPTVAPQEASEHADAVVIGEAEPVIERLLEDARRGELQPAYEAVGGADLSALEPPKWELLRSRRYQWIKSVEEIRGCAYDCSFCSANKIFGSRVRCRPVERVVEELASMKEHFAFFTANDIAANKSYARRLFHALTPLGKKWFSQASVEMAEDEELVELAARSGCVGLLVGFESLVGHHLKKARHAFEHDRRAYYEKIIETFHKYRIALIGCFVFGLDEQDEEIFGLTKDFIEETNIDVPQLTVATPYPGTKMREELDGQGRLLPLGWEYYDAVRTTIVPLQMPLEMLREGYDWIGQTLFSYGALWHRVRRSRDYLQERYRSYGVVLPINLVYRKLYELSHEPPRVDPA